jgi:hypothetical protein
MIYAVFLSVSFYDRKLGKISALLSLLRYFNITSEPISNSSTTISCQFANFATAFAIIYNTLDNKMR